MAHTKNPQHIPSPFRADAPDMTPEQKEQEYVHNVYQVIAPHFSATRYKPWPVVEEFLLTMPPGYVGADVGCGNGKYIGVNPRLFMVGSDRSSNLISICGERGHEAMDFAISIAVIHHFISPERRIAAIQEILRVVRVGGRILIFVWALEQTGKRDFDKTVQDVFVPWAMPKKSEPKRDRTTTTKSRPQGVKKRRDQANASSTSSSPTTTTTTTSTSEEASSSAVTESMDQLTIQPSTQQSVQSASSSASTSASTSETPATAQETGAEDTDPAAGPSATAAPVYNRYYHLFQKGELEELVGQTNKASIVQTGYDRDNWWCIVEKTSD
ncbi:tRNA methyltransferase, has a role in tRNA modification [Dissophora ornata]|nr:tRNA methyltransferase, has a role in tRNA modification [Dissophora ornata]